MEENNASFPVESHKSNLIKPLGVLFIALCFLIPIIVYPGIFNLHFTMKMAVITTISTLCLLSILLSIISTGEIEFPKTKLTALLFLLPLAAIISSIFSGSIYNSILGNAFEIGTASSFLILFVLFLLSVMAGSKRKFLDKYLFAFLFSMSLNLLYTLFIMAVQSGWVKPFNGLPINLIGSYIDVALLLGAGMIISTCLLSFRDLSKKTKIFLWVFLALSTLNIGAIGFVPIEIMLAAFSLMMFVYLISISRNQGGVWVKKSYSTLFVLFTSIVLLVSGSFGKTQLANMFKFDAFDVRPNTSTTFSIVKSEWAHNPITGSGPNRFVELWALYKPASINQTNFWSTDFFFGSGLFLTLAATTGLIGILAILAFLVMYIRAGFKVFFYPETDKMTKFFSLTFFLTSLFLWLSIFFYPPGLAVLAFTFIFSGLFISSLSQMGGIQNYRINIFSNPKANFVSVFSVVVFMIGLVVGEYMIWEKLFASVIFSRAASQFSIDGDFKKAASSLDRAAGLSSSDLYKRSLAELYLLNVEKIVSQVPQNSTDIPDNLRDELQSSVANALQYSRDAIAVNPSYYQNHYTLARVYESLSSKGIPGASDSAMESYKNMEKYDPHDPNVQLAYSRLSAQAGDLEKAKEYVDKAISLKSNFTDAYFVLAQLESASNNIPGAIRAVEATTLIDPGNSALYFQLGLLKYSVGDNAGAATAFEKAVSILPDYANAKYFLGLSYYRIGRREDAIKQFEEIKVTNPDNKEVDFILTNLKANKNPFADAKPPIDARPQDRSKPPVDENM